MGIQINGQTDTIKAIDGSLTMPGTVTYEDVSRVNVTGVSTFAANVHVSDSIAHLGDTDTAIRFPQSNTFTIETAGTEKLRITSDGNVGIGEDTPNRLLHLKAASSTAYSGGDDSADYNFLKIENTTDDKSAGIFFKIGSNGESAITATEVSDGNTDITFQNRGGGIRSEKVRITSTGLVGIGTDNPSTGLHLMGADAYFTMQGSQTDSNAGILFKDSAETQNGVILYDFDNDYLKFSVSNDTEALRLYSTGMMGHFGGATNNSGNLSNGTLFRINTSASVPASSSITIRISGLNSGWATLRGGGYSSAGQSMFSVFYHFGGFMTASHTWDVHTVREWISGGSITTTKNSNSWDITITNNSASYTLSVPFTLESSLSTMKLESI